MANGTINLVNNSTALTGVDSEFLTEVTPGDFIYIEIGDVPYTLPVDSVNSDSSITLLRKFIGPTTSGLVWVLIPRRAQNAVYSKLADQVSQALLQALTNEDNWQQLLTGEGDVTITRPDGSTYTGPSWPYITSIVSGSDIESVSALAKQVKDDATQVASDKESASKSAASASENASLADQFGAAAESSAKAASSDAESAAVDSEKATAEADRAERAAELAQTANPDNQLKKANNLSDVEDIEEARRNIKLSDNDIVDIVVGGLGTAAFKDAQESTIDTTSGRILTVGAFNLGVSFPSGASIRLQDGSTPTGFYGSGGDGYSEIGVSADLTTFTINRGNRPTRIHQAYSLKRTWFSYYSGSAWTYHEAYTTGNTTKASDGTLKAASPIVKLFANGSFETNEESEGATVTRLDVGQYLIEGCEALNSDAAWGGWDGGFDIPTDRNKQPLIWLDYDVNPDGSVLVKTYHRTHPDSPEFARNRIGYKNDAGDFIETVANGDPVDIPSDQFVSVRVEMPQDSIWNQRQKEIAEMMDAEISSQESTTGDEVEKS